MLLSLSKYKLLSLSNRIAKLELDDLCPLLPYTQRCTIHCLHSPVFFTILYLIVTIWEYWTTHIVVTKGVWLQYCSTVGPQAVHTAHKCLSPHQQLTRDQAGTLNLLNLQQVKKTYQNAIMEADIAQWLVNCIPCCRRRARRLFNSCRYNCWASSYHIGWYYTLL